MEREPRGHLECLYARLVAVERHDGELRAGLGLPVQHHVLGCLAQAQRLRSCCPASAHSTNLSADAMLTIQRHSGRQTSQELLANRGANER